MNMEIKQEIIRYIASKAETFYKVSDDIWDAAETAFEEYKSAEVLCKALEEEGFEVSRGIAGIETAFCGKAGSGGPVIGILGEFDALSGLSQVSSAAEKMELVKGGNGHGCGHNMLGAGSLAAAVGIKKYLEESGTPGTVIYYGCPGEEGGSGKTFMARDGIFDGLDFALCWHPGDYGHIVWPVTTLANYQIRYRFHGVSAHAAADPFNGRSALDAVELMNVGVQFLREHIISDARIHYAITNTGGFSPNVVQAYAEVLYLIRAPKNSQVEEIYQRVNKIAEGAARMTETEVSVEFVKACSNIVLNHTISKALQDNLVQVSMPEYTEEELENLQSFADTVKGGGATPLPLPKAKGPIRSFVVPLQVSEMVGPGSTDVGDVSLICPTGQIMVSTWAAGTPGHSWQVVAQGKSSFAHKGLLYAGQVLAGAAIDILENPVVLEEAKAEFERRTEGKAYACPIPKDVKPGKISVGD